MEQIAGIIMAFTLVKLNGVLHDGKTEHIKALAKKNNTSAIADYVKIVGYIKWDHFDILAKGKTDYHYKTKT